MELTAEKKAALENKTNPPKITIEIGKIKLEISEEILSARLEEILKVVLKIC